MDPWWIYGSASAQAVKTLDGAAVSEGPVEGQYVLRVVVPAAGANFWDAGLGYGFGTFKAGKKYTLSAFFKSKSGTFQINMKPELGADPWSGYGEQQKTMTNEWVEYSVTTPVFAADTSPANLTFHIAFAAGEFWVDCVRFYEGDYVPPQLGPKLKAYKPTPASGAQVTTSWLSLGWTRGDTAVSHDVYFGDNYNAVAAGTGGTFRVNQPLASTWYIVGAGLPGDPAPGGLQPGKTYYWRIDEVEASGTTKNIGDVWSFWLPSLAAFNPTPIDGLKFIDPNVDLSWSPGWGVKIHYVYFGTDYNTVNNATTGGLPVGATTYDPGSLARATTYYWRVDEFDGVKTTKGTTWSFTTAKAGGGLRAEYYNCGAVTSPANPFQTLLLVRIDPQVNFSWGDAAPDAAVPVDGFAVRWTGDIEIPTSDTYTFYTTTDDGARLWVNGQQIVNQWVDQGTTEVSGTIQLAAGIYPIEMHYYENAGGAVAQLLWSSSKIGKSPVPQAALALPVKASGPRPGNGAVDVRRDVALRWQPGVSAVSHEVYFGTSATAVTNATKASAEYKGSKPRGTEEYDPGILQLNQTYYWKVDEVNTSNPDSPWKGNIWSFTVGNFLTIDDMEDYNNFPPDRIFETWVDGWANQAVNGAIVGHPDPDFAAGEGFAETSIRHGGLQSMPYYYNCNFKYSEAVMTLKAPMRDWTQEGVKSLTLWFQGYPATQGSLTESPAGTFTMTGAGSDIWTVNSVEADEFHYAWKMLNGPGTITAKVSAITGTNLNGWAKAGLMIRESLDPNSAHAHMLLSATNGIALQYRPTAAGTSATSQQLAAVSQRPQWLRLDRAFDGTFTASHANDVGGAPDKWTAMTTTTIQMAANVYIGLALTSHQAYVQAQATFSGITLAGTITGATWTHQDIGIRSNGPERMFVAIQGTTGPQAIVYNTDPQAATRNTWTEWNIPLTAFTGINLSNVDRISIGFGTKGNTSPGGSGLMYFDDIRLYKGRCFPLLVRPDADFSNNCVVDMTDLEILANNWLIKNWQVTPVAPSNAGLVAYYALENNTNDGSGNAHHGDPCGAPTYVSGPAGYSKAMLFNGQGNQWVDLETFDPSAGTGQLTVSLWANWNGLSSYYQGLMGKRDTWSATDMMWQIEANLDTGAISFSRNGSYPDCGGRVLPIGQWANVAVTFDGTTATFYINGEKTGSGAFTFGTDPTARMQFGSCQASGGNPFNGALDEVRLYNRALSQAEVASLAGRTAFTQPLVLLLRPQDPKMDSSSDGQINFKDYAVLIDHWLEERLWP
jgi:hypothetical protein